MARKKTEAAIKHPPTEKNPTPIILDTHFLKAEVQKSVIPESIPPASLGNLLEMLILRYHPDFDIRLPGNSDSD